MNKKQWLGLLMVYVSYLLLGATAFYFLEEENEEDRKTRFQTFLGINDTLHHIFGKNTKNRDVFRLQLTEYCGKTFSPKAGIEEVVPIIWDFYNAFFFVVTVVSTVGYGNLHPTSDTGRAVMVFYAILGIPLNGILLTSLGQFFGAVFHKAHSKYKSRQGNYGKRYKLAINVMTYLAPGLIIFIFLPAGVFSFFEDWTYVESVYYAFVTLSTIGFGDIVAGQKRHVDGVSEGILMFYKVLLIFWVIFGLGYLIMLLGFVAQAMQNKKIIKLEQKLLASVTHSRIWHGFSKDIGYLRRMMNEVYLEKLKPVFKDEQEPVPKIMHRSKSLPDLKKSFESVTDATLLPRRERAMSEAVPHKLGLTRVFSETDLQRIDRKATFAAATTVPTTFELMKRVIDAYAGAQSREWPANEDDSDESLEGEEGFSEEDILASENWQERQQATYHNSTHHSSVFEAPTSGSGYLQRDRAMSECPATEMMEQEPSTNPAGADWTWSGPNANKLHDIMKQRNKQRLLMGLHKGRAGSISSAVIAGARKINPLRKRRRCVTENNSANASGENVSKHTLSVPVDIGRKRASLQDGKAAREYHGNRQYMTTTAVPNASQDNFPHRLHQLYSRGDHLFSGDSDGQFLEETSLADFLRVLTTLHSQVGERLVTHNQRPKPRRKMGTDGLNPPRIKNLLEFFPQPPGPSTPKSKRRKPSKLMDLFRTDSKREAKDTDSITAMNEKTPAEPSNLKRLGRFLLRSYSTTPKDTEDIPRSLRRHRFSLWPSESEGKDAPPFQVQVDSPSSTSTDVTIRIEPDENSSTPIYPSRPSRSGGTPGLLFAPTTTPPAARRRASSSASRKLSPGQWSFDTDSGTK